MAKDKAQDIKDDNQLTEEEIDQIEKVLKDVDLETRREYNFLDVIHREDKEDIITEWLAFFLDPQRCGSEKPLKQFCELLRDKELEKNKKKFDYSEEETAIRKKELDIEYFDNKNIEVETQYVLKNKKRPDILIWMDNSWIVVENKIKSWEHGDQTKYYYDEISKDSNGMNVKYIYLKPDYNQSEPECKDFEVVTYSDLAVRWESIVRKNFSRKAEYYYFAELMKLIKGKYAMSNEIHFTPNTELYLNNYAKFKAIEASVMNDGEIVMKKLNERLEEIFTSKGDWRKIKYKPGYIQFCKTNWNTKLHFEIQNADFNKLVGKDICITYCLHAEGYYDKAVCDAIKDIEEKNNHLFGNEKYDFDQDNCSASLDKIAERLEKIRDKFTSQIDKIIKPQSDNQVAQDNQSPDNQSPNNQSPNNTQAEE